MTDLLTRMDIKFHDRARRMQERFQKLKTGTKGGINRAEDGFYDYIDDVEEALERGRSRIAAASDIVEDWVLDTQETMDHWRANRETKKLMKTADGAERHAESAMDVAMAALDEAEVALGRALLFRSYAEDSARDEAVIQER